MKYGYARVSAEYQNEGRQLEALSPYVESDRIYIDKASGKDFERTEWQHLIKALHPHDELYVKSLDRLGRNKDLIKQELTKLHDMKVIVHIIDLPTTLIEPATGTETVIELINTLLMEVLTWVAENERFNIRKRQTEGIDMWRKTGRTKTGKAYGRPKSYEINERFIKAYEAWKAGEIKAVQAFEQAGISKASFYRAVKEYEGRA